MTNLTRRQVLSVLGASGATALVGHSALARTRETPYQQYTYARSESGALRVAWYETYNGQLTEVSGNATSTNSVANASSTAYVDSHDDTTPVIHVSNVLPGDWGELVVGLTAEDVPLDVWLQLQATDTDVGTPEPEGDAPESGLAEVIDAEVWLDDCDGTSEAGDSWLVGGTLDSVAGALVDGAHLDFGGVGDCANALPVGETRCVRFSWTLATAVDNRAMADGVSFDITFGAVDCPSETNPFAEVRL